MVQEGLNHNIILMKKALLVSLSNDCDEIKALARTLGYEVVKEFVQHRKEPDVKTYVGKGKLEEIKDFVKNNSVDLVIINGDLKPSQWFYLEKELGKNVYDRMHLILSIFAERADSKEAKLQVKLAQLRYERPFVRELIHRAKAGEHPGFLAGGEYKVDDYYVMIKRQMVKIRRELEKVRQDRSIRRKHRYEVGFYLIAIVGYTNAGKSSLLNILSNEHIKVDEMLFSTLSPTTRRLIKKSKPPILLTDTVGFIRDLPSWVIEAFRSTLEEIKDADLILLMVDVSEEIPVIKEKLRTSFRELKEIGISSPIIVVFNKTDKISEEELNQKVMELRKEIYGKTFVCISAKHGKNIDKLIDAIAEKLPSAIHARMILPLSKRSQQFLSDLYCYTWIKNVRYSKNIEVDLLINQRIFDKVANVCKSLGGKIKHLKEE